MINLEKKKPFNLSKAAPGLNQVKVGLSWDPSGDVEVDADASVFMLNESGKIPGETFFVFFNNLASGDGAVVHSGDNRTGEGDGDDEGGVEWQQRQEGRPPVVALAEANANEPRGDSD